MTSTLQSFRKLIFQNGFSVSQLFETTASLPDLKILSGRCIQVGVNATFFQKFSAMNIVYHLQKCNETTEITDFLKYFENNLARAAAHLIYLIYLRYRIVHLQAAKFVFCWHVRSRGFIW